MSDIKVRYSRSETWTLGDGAQAVEVRVEVEGESISMAMDGMEYTPDEARKLAAMLTAAANRCEDLDDE